MKIAFIFGSFYSKSPVVEFHGFESFPNGKLLFSYHKQKNSFADQTNANKMED
jgi:hypothetical protein